MDDSLDRLASMTRQLAVAGMPFTRVQGLRGDALPPRMQARFFAGQAPDSRLKVGEIGCFAAHLSVFEGMTAGLYPPVVLVLEDDCTLPPNLRATVGAVLQGLPAGWNMVRLCNIPKRAYVPLARLRSGQQLIRYSRIPNYAGAYLVSLSGAEKLLRHGRPTLPFDEYLRRPWLHGCDVYGIWPPVVDQRLDIPSCIEVFGGRQAGREPVLNKAIRKLDLHNLPKRLAFNIRVLGPLRWLACAALNGGARVLRRRAGRILLHRGSALLASVPGDRGPDGAERRAAG